jgi:hypothetical protein
MEEGEVAIMPHKECNMQPEQKIGDWPTNYTKTEPVSIFGIPTYNNPYIQFLRGDEQSYTEL